jgi:hypothetical protein
MYTSSWIGQYYGYVGSVHDEHVVVFAGRTGKKVNIIENNTRFYVNVLFPDSNVQTYFFPPSTWQRIGPSLQQDLLVFRTDTLSAMNHGMITDGYPYSKSPFYTAPFFLTFKTDHSVVSNFLTFNDFLIPNSYGRFLNMLNFDEDRDKFISAFEWDIHLPYQKTPSLPGFLEFKIVDANLKQVHFLDSSRLYICIEVLKKK